MLLQQGIELSLAVERIELVVPADMPVADENLWHGTLSVSTRRHGSPQL